MAINVTGRIARLNPIKRFTSSNQASANFSHLEASTWLYLGLPVLLFLLTWFRLAIVIIFLLLLVILLYLRHRAPPSVLTTSSYIKKSLLFGFFPIFVVLALSGIGGFGPQDGDWPKHNAILQALIDEPWPVYFDIAAGQVSLVYYIAYYLPAALVGKMAGWVAANVALFLFTVIGCWLAYLWVIKLSGASPFISGLFLIAFSGLDAIGTIILQSFVLENVAAWELFTDLLFRRTMHLENWANPFQYSGNTTLLFWVPQHGLSGWLGTALMLWLHRKKELANKSLFLLSLIPLWSAFVAIGLGALIGVAFLYEFIHPAQQKFNRYYSVENLVGIIILGLLSAYFATTFQTTSIEQALPASIESGLQFIDLSDGLVRIKYFTFVCVEVGLFLLFVAVFSKSAESFESWRIFYFPIVLFLVILPLFRFGLFNDLVMRVSIPFLMVLMLMLCNLVASQSLPMGGRLFLLLLLAISSITSIVEIRRHISLIVQNEKFWKLDEDAVTTLFYQQAQNIRRSYPPANSFDPFQLSAIYEEQAESDKNEQFLILVNQYIAPTNTSFVRYLGRVPGEQPHKTVDTLSTINVVTDVGEGQFDLINFSIEPNLEEMNHNNTLTIVGEWAYSGVISQDYHFCYGLLNENRIPKQTACVNPEVLPTYLYSLGETHTYTITMPIDPHLIQGPYQFAWSLVEDGRYISWEPLRDISLTMPDRSFERQSLPDQVYANWGEL